MGTIRSVRQAVASAIVVVLAVVGTDTAEAGTLVAKQTRQNIELDYHTSKPGKPGSEVKCQGGALSQAVECVGERIGADNQGGTAGASSDAAARVPITPSVYRDDTANYRPYYVVLSAETGSIGNINGFTPEEQVKLRRDLFVAKSQLSRVRLKLTDAQVKTLLTDRKPITVDARQGWDPKQDLSLLEVVQSKFQVTPPVGELTFTDQGAPRQVRNNTVDLLLTKVPLFVDTRPGELPLLVHNEGSEPATDLKLDLKNSAPFCPYDSGCEGDSDGLLARLALCLLDGDRQAGGSCSRCDLAAPGKGADRARYRCPGARIPPGATADLTLKLEPKPKEPVLIADDVGEVDSRQWPVLSVIVSSKEKDSNTANNRVDANSPGFGPQVTGLRFLTVREEEGPHATLHPSETVENGQPLVLEAKLDARVGLADRSKPVAYANLRRDDGTAATERVGLFASTEGASVLRSRNLKTGDGAQDPPEIEAESEGETATIKVVFGRGRSGRPVAIQVLPLPVDEDNPATSLVPGSRFQIRLAFAPHNYPSRSDPLRVSIWRSRMGDDQPARTISVKHHETARHVYLSEVMTADQTTLLGLAPKDLIEVEYDESVQRFEVDEPETVADSIAVVAPAAEVKSIELITGRTGAAAQQIATDGSFRARVTFSTPPADDVDNLDLRVVRDGRPTAELIEPLQWQKRADGVAASSVASLADDRRFGRLLPGDRIEARYGDGKWAPSESAALEVTGSPGKVSEIRFLVDGKSAQNVPVGGKFQIEAVYEAPPNGGDLGSVVVKTGANFDDPDYSPGSPQSISERLEPVAGDERRFRTAPIGVWGAEDPPTAPRVRALAGYSLEAHLGGASATANVVDGALRGKARLTILLHDGYGHVVEMPATARDGRRRVPLLTGRPARLSAGRYTIEVALPVTFRQDIELKSGGERTLEIPSADVGTLEIDYRDGLGRRQVPPTVGLFRKTTGPKGWSNQVNIPVKPSSRLDLPRGAYELTVDSFFADVDIEGGRVTTQPFGHDRGRVKLILKTADGQALARRYSAGAGFSEVRGTTGRDALTVHSGNQAFSVDTPVASTSRTLDVQAGREIEETMTLARIQIRVYDGAGKLDPGAGVSVLEPASEGAYAVGKTLWSGKPGSLDLPAGTYQVKFETRFPELSAPFTVGEGQILSIEPRKRPGRLVVNAGLGVGASDLRLTVVGADAGEVRIGTPIDLLPGLYQVQATSTRDPGVTYADGAQVNAGKVTTLTLSGDGKLLIVDPFAGRRTGRFKLLVWHLQRLSMLETSNPNLPRRTLALRQGQYIIDTDSDQGRTRNTVTIEPGKSVTYTLPR